MGLFDKYEGLRAARRDLETLGIDIARVITGGSSDGASARVLPALASTTHTTTPGQS